MAARFWNLLLGLGLVGLTVALAFSLRPSPRAGKPAGDLKQQKASDELVALAPRESVDFSHYAVLTRTNIFRGPAPGSASPRAPKATPLSRLPQFPFQPLTGAGPDLPSAPAAPADPLADWSYSGYLLMNGERVGVLENKRTREAHFLRKGEKFQDAIVAQVSERELGLSREGKVRKLPIAGGGVTVFPGSGPAEAPAAPAAETEPKPDQ